MPILKRLRSWWLTVGFLSVSLWTAYPPSVTASMVGRGVTLIAATDARVEFEVDLSGYVISPSRHLTGTDVIEVAGFGSFSKPGEPAVPGRTLIVGLPPQGNPSLTWRAVTLEPLGERRLEPVPFPLVRADENGVPFADEAYRIDRSVYDGAPSTIRVAADDVLRIRHQRVLPVRVVPVAYNPLTGETAIATRIRVEITFPSGPQGGRAPGGPQVVPVQESPVWEHVFDRILVNPEQSGPWRVREVGRLRDLSQNLRAAEVVSGPLVKLLVRQTGLHRVNASTVVGKGFPAGTPVSDLHVFKRGYDTATHSEAVTDVPHRLVEDPTGVDGVFDRSDWIVFYGRRLREDDAQEDPLEKFSGTNVYWLGASGGAPMATVSVPPGVAGPDTSTATFPVVDHFEEDNIFYEPTPPGEKEFFYYDGGWGTSFSTSFVTTSIDPDGAFQLKARFLGGARNTDDRVVKLSIRNAKGTTPLEDAAVPNKSVVHYASQVLSANVVEDGENTLRLDKTAERTALGALLDWFTIEYRAKYRAKGNVLEFNSADLAGDTSITVTGLGRTDLMLFDVTDPTAPREYGLTTGHFTNTGNGFALSFREGLSSRKSYVLTHIDGIRQITSGDVVEDAPSRLIGNPAEAGVDILVVSHADFLNEMQRWVGYRRAQGYRVLMADVQDIFDEFNGGVPNPRGIKKFVRHFFENGGASFVVLVGDASEDNKHVYTRSGENFVPTESFTEYVGGVFDDEVVTTDKWYAMLDYDFITDVPPSVQDVYPDVIIGRLPVGTAGELRDVLDKIFEFESPKGDDFWRRRMVRVADNAFSPLTSFDLCYKSGEEDFRVGEEVAAQKAENAIPGGFDIVRVYLADYLEDVEPAHQPGSCVMGSVLINPTRARATPALINELNAGATVVSFQAHMNRSQICHEFLFSTAPVYGTPDHQRFTNVDTPWIVYGMGCHMSDYAIYNELALSSTNPPNGDAMAELLLLQKAGAVATYGSAGFEYLTPNKNLTGIIAETFFENVPTDTMIGSSKAQARWILGELMTLTEIENLARWGYSGSGDGAVGQTKRFHLLGDPVLRIDAGPPRFEVTVNGAPFASGDNVASAGGDLIDVRAIVTDEVAIEKLTLEIDHADSTERSLSVRPLLDEGLTASRRYEARFQHLLRAKNYDIILRAYQAEDTTSGDYHLAAEFVLKVQASVELAVNGRPVSDGDLVPPKGDYLFTVTLPIFVEQSLLRVETDGEPVTGVNFSHPSPEDSTTWLVNFRQELSPGPHEVTLFVDEGHYVFTVVVGSRSGVFDLIAYPNPFSDDVYFVFTNELGITAGSIDVFTVSGKKVAHLDIPPQSRSPGQSAVRWDGRTHNGDEVANGVYLFVVSVEQGGQKTTHRGKLARAQ